MATEQEEPVAQTTGNEPISQRDDVHSDVAAAIKQLKGDEQPEPLKIEDYPDPIDKGDHPTDPTRYADGKFKPTKTEAAPEKAAPVETKLPPTDDTTKLTAEPVKAPSAAPVGWAADAKTDWDKLSPAVQAAVIKRETDISNGGRQWSEEKRRYEETLTPVRQVAAKHGIDERTAIQRLTAAQDMLERNPAQGLAWLAESYGVDLKNLESNPPAPQAPRFDPMVHELSQKYSTLEIQLQGFLQNQTLSVVDRFAQDNPHFEAVQGELTRLIPVVQQNNPGLAHADVLKQAYEQAIWLNPDVRAQMIAEQTAQAQKTQTDVIKAKAVQASKAAVSVKGSSNGATVPKAAITSSGDIYDDVRAAIHQLRN